MCSLPKSKTTRIETRPAIRHGTGYWCSLPKSKTTRIETFLSIGLSIRPLRFFTKIQNNKDWNLVIFLAVSNGWTVLYQNPKQQGLKLGDATSFDISFLFVLYQNPKQQGLKHLSPSSLTNSFSVLYQNPKQQGLKLSTNSISLSIIGCSLPKSKTTRIETLVAPSNQCRFFSSLPKSKTTRIETVKFLIWARPLSQFFTKIQNNKDWNFFCRLYIHFIALFFTKIQNNKDWNLLFSLHHMSLFEFFTKIQNNKDWN